MFHVKHWSRSVYFQRIDKEISFREIALGNPYNQILRACRTSKHYCGYIFAVRRKFEVSYIDLLKAYLNSKEFQQYIEELSKKETKIYIDAFIYFTSTYIDFFLNYKPNKSSNYLNKNPQFSSNTEEINNASDFNIPNSMILPSTIFEVKEDDNDFSESLIFSGIEDYEFRRENNSFIGRNLDLKKKISY